MMRTLAPLESFVVTAFLATVVFLGWDRFGDGFLAVAMAIGAITGLLLTLWTLRDTFLELSAIRSRHTSHEVVLTLIAEANFRREALRAFTFACLASLCVSVWFMISNPTMSRSLLLASIIALIANSILDRLERRRSSAYLKRELAARSAEQH